MSEKTTDLLYYDPFNLMKEKQLNTCKNFEKAKIHFKTYRGEIVPLPLPNRKSY